MPTYLENELKRSPFDHKLLQYFFYETKERFEAVKKLEEIFAQDPLFQNPENDHFLSRSEQVRLAVARGFRAHQILKQHKDFLGMHSPAHGEGGMPVGRFSNSFCGLTDHYALFVQTIMGQGTPEQVREWLPKALNLEIIGTYAQTELGHGSNVRGLETIATYEEATDTLRIDSPTITASKWWPGALGLLATHAVLHVQLIVKEKHLGYHTVMVQLRDEKHEPLPGIEVGDIGPKMGGTTMDAGYLRLTGVAVPRTNMLAKFQKLEKGGAYHCAPAATMLVQWCRQRYRTAQHNATWSRLRLSQGLQIALRFQVTRRQGFITTSSSPSSSAAAASSSPPSRTEVPILDHKIQAFRLLPIVAQCYALRFASDALDALWESSSVQPSNAPSARTTTSPAWQQTVTGVEKVAALAQGVHAVAVEWSAAGLEEARRCCGGFGFTLASGIAALAMDAAGPVSDRFGKTCAEIREVAKMLLREQMAAHQEAPPRRSRVSRRLRSGSVASSSFTAPLPPSSVRPDAPLHDAASVNRWALEIFKGAADRAVHDAFESFCRHRRSCGGVAGDENNESSLSSAASAFLATDLQWQRAATLYVWWWVADAFVAFLSAAALAHEQKHAPPSSSLAQHASGSAPSSRGSAVLPRVVLSPFYDLSLVFLLRLLQNCPQDILRATHSQHQLIDRELHAALDRLRPHAVLLTEGFGWPDDSLASIVAPSHGDAARMHGELLAWAKSSPLNATDVVRDRIHRDVLSATLDPTLAGRRATGPSDEPRQATAANVAVAPSRL